MKPLYGVVMWPGDITDIRNQPGGTPSTFMMTPKKTNYSTVALFAGSYLFGGIFKTSILQKEARG